VVEVTPLALDVLVLPLQERDRCAAPFAPLLATAYATLGSGELPLCTAVVARIRYHLAIRSHDKHLQPHVDAGLFARQWQRLCGHLGTREASVPPVSKEADGDGLWGALEWTVQPQRDTADLGEAEDSAIERCTAMLAHLRIGEAVIAIPALEAGEPRLLTRLHAAEEGGKRSIQSVQYLQDQRAEVAVVGPHLVRRPAVGRIAWRS
jgi:hypothetical protein